MLAAILASIQKELKRYRNERTKEGRKAGRQEGRKAGRQEGGRAVIAQSV
jgi:DNA invertase Pin-like site-specific DNA recombinase